MSSDKGWQRTQRTSIQAAAAYLRQRIAPGDADPRTKVIYEGLLDVLEPSRRAMRLQGGDRRRTDRRKR
jgi:hypothetical protein